MNKEDENYEKKKKNNYRLVESIDSLFCVQNPVPLNYLSISMYPAATIMYMQSLPRAEPN